MGPSLQNDLHMWETKNKRIWGWVHEKCDFCQVKLQKAKARRKWHEGSPWKVCLSQHNSNPKLAFLGEVLSPFWFALKTHDIFQRLALQCPTSLGCPDILTVQVHCRFNTLLLCPVPSTLPPWSHYEASPSEFWPPHCHTAVENSNKTKNWFSNKIN